MLTSRMIEAFRAVILNGSMSKAAGFMNISQPAVSRLIKDLELEVGFNLFERRQGRVIANKEALTFYEEIHRSFVGMDRITKAAEKIKNQETGILRIASMPAVGLSIMPIAIANFQKKRPDISISFQVVRSETVMQLITALQCDIGIVEGSFTAAAIDEGPTYNLNTVCVLPPEHPLGANKTIKPKHLAGERFISLGPDSKTRYKIDAIFETAGIKRSMHIETPLTNVACALVQQGCGITIVDPLTAAVFLKQGLIVRPFLPSSTFSFRTLASSHISGTSLVQEFYEVFSQTLPESALTSN